MKHTLPEGRHRKDTREHALVVAVDESKKSVKVVQVSLKLYSPAQACKACNPEYTCILDECRRARCSSESLTPGYRRSVNN